MTIQSRWRVCVFLNLTQTANQRSKRHHPVVSTFLSLIRFVSICAIQGQPCKPYHLLSRRTRRDILIISHEITRVYQISTPIDRSKGMPDFFRTQKPFTASFISTPNVTIPAWGDHPFLRDPEWKSLFLPSFTIPFRVLGFVFLGSQSPTYRAA